MHHETLSNFAMAVSTVRIMYTFLYIAILTTLFEAAPDSDEIIPLPLTVSPAGSESYRVGSAFDHQVERWLMMVSIADAGCDPIAGKPARQRAANVLRFFATM